MSENYAVSLNGIRDAERSLDEASRRIAKTGPRSSEISANSEAESDIAMNLIDAKRAEITAKANMRALSMQDELEKDALNLFV
jgi:hypothetical protein